jgi:transposase
MEVDTDGNGKESKKPKTKKRKVDPNETSQSNKRLKTDPEKPKEVIFQTIKHKLKTILRKEIQEKFQTTLDPIVVSFNRFAHEVTIFANGFVSWILEQEEFPVPTINRTFYDDCIKAIQGRTTPSPAVNHFALTEWSGEMDCKEVKGLSVPLQTLSVQLTTNGQNHLWVCFRQRQFQALRIQTKNYHAIQTALYSCLNPSETKFEDTGDQKIHQEHFDILFQKERPKKISDSWLKKNSDTVLVYYKYLMTIQCQELQKRTKEMKENKKLTTKQPRIKTFSYLPIQSYQRACIEIQGKDVLVLLRRMGFKVPSRYKEDMKYDLWRKLLNFPFQKGRWHFNGTLVTDGVQVSVLWWREGNEPPETKKKVDLTTVSRGLFSPEQIQPTSQLEVIGIDPGRNYLLTASNGFSLSKRQYYEECGLNTTKNRREWFLQQQTPEIQDLIHQAANQTFRVPDFKAWKLNWESRKPLESLLFRFYGDKRFRNHKFFVHTRRQKCLDRAFNRLVNGLDLSKTVIAFGNGKFPTSSKGEKSGPLSSLARKLSTRLRVIMTDEFKTSKTCNACFGLHSNRKMYSYVWNRESKSHSRVFKSPYEILQCTNCSRWHQRDSNASKNIQMLLEYVLNDKPRPEAFCRGKLLPSVNGREGTLVPT